MKKTQAGSPARWKNSSLVVALATGLVAACGGGGGGGGAGLTPADATVVIDANNAIDLVRNAEDPSTFAERIILGLIVDTATVLSASATATAANSGNDGALAATAASAEHCNGGEADVNESGLMVIFTFFNCQDFNYISENLGTVQFAGTLDGNLRIDVSALSSSETDFQATITMTSLSITDANGTAWGNGSLELDYLETASRTIADITTTAFDFELDSATRSLTTYNYFQVADAAETTEESNGGINSSDFDFLAYFETPVPFVTIAGNPWPTAGQRVIYGANQASIQITAQSDGLNALVELDLDATDGFETSCTYSWEELLGGGPIIACAD